MALVLKDTQQVTITVAPLDAKGNAAVLGSVPVWVSSDATVLTLTPSADGLTCVAAANKTGVTQLTVTADADVGDGVQNITGLLDIQVVAGVAVSLSVTAGVPEEIVVTPTETTETPTETVEPTETTTETPTETVEPTA